jgi:hypothetical protein
MLRPVDTCGSCRNQPTQLVAASDFSTYEQWICFYFRIFQASPHHLIFRLNVSEPNLVERLIPAVGTISERL